MSELDLTADIIDVRDITDRIEELSEARIDFELDDDGNTTARDWAEANPEDADEFKKLTAILEDIRGGGGDHQWAGDWYPVTLIRDSYFVDYAQQLVQDIGDLPNGIPSYIEIDWEAMANNIRVDYTSTEIDGVTYWYR